MRKLQEASDCHRLAARCWPRRNIMRNEHVSKCSGGLCSYSWLATGQAGPRGESALAQACGHRWRAQRAGHPEPDSRKRSRQGAIAPRSRANNPQPSETRRFECVADSAEASWITPAPVAKTRGACGRTTPVPQGGMAPPPQSVAACFRGRPLVTTAALPHWADFRGVCKHMGQLGTQFSSQDAPKNSCPKSSP